MFNKKENLKLSDLIDIEFLQEFQDFFAKTMGIASIAIDENGLVTKPSNFTDFCTNFVRNEKSSLKECDEIHSKEGKISAEIKEAVIYTCPNGLTEFAVPILVKEQHIGTLIGGQVFLESPDEDHYRKVATQLGIDEDKYIKALKMVKIIPIEKAKEAAHLLFLISSAISKIADEKLELLEKCERGTLYKNIVETIRNSLDSWLY